MFDEKQVRQEIELWELEMNEVRYKYNNGEINEEQFDDRLRDIVVRIEIYMSGEYI